MATAKKQPPTLAVNGVADEVFTLAEAAVYLRVNEADVIGLVRAGDLPGKSIGKEWRFLKVALQDWLRTPPPKTGKEAVLARIGSWQDDPYLDEELKEIHRRRGRPEDGR